MANIRKKITILMPTLNEEAGVGPTVRSIPVESLEKAGYEPEILVVDGGSTDDTVAVAEGLGARVVVSRQGYGAQYKRGFAEANGEVILTADSDHSYPLEIAPHLLAIFEREGVDFISVNRFARLESGSMHPANYVANRVLTVMADLLFGIRLKDVQSGMWVIRKSALGRLKLDSDDMTFSQEIKIEAFTKLNAVEADGGYRKRIGTVKLSRLRDGLRVLLHLFKKRWAMR